MKSLIVFLFLLASLPCFSNDGAYRVNGNQLIPVYETDISVKKEILTIKRINERFATITVNYEFFNPGKGKELIVGFEAYTPSGDVDPSPVNGHHPYISKFTVNLNGLEIPYKLAYVKDSLYYKNGKFKSLTLAQAQAMAEETDYPEFFYVYHFKAAFKEGLNTLVHTYIVELSSSITDNYYLNYILSAAGRWANRQIDDFTLNIDMGDFQDLNISNSFFRRYNEWELKGNVKAIQERVESEGENRKYYSVSRFFIEKGSISFSKKNFKPTGELLLVEHNGYYYRWNNGDDLFDSKRDGLPYPIESQDAVKRPADELSRRILKNLPFARRGYIFKAPELQSYFEKQPWYRKNEQYQPVLENLTAEEKKWLSTL
ncbi:YARHG domain-containing protein [Pseudoflavitalea sp. G-6-1-2]|uniref:YARHG domain-containing protein n=1 Tax=Pseudoflavitalea sp. G-6-1-2 TaxID=2728841 RepID=UPI00146C5196|nr:YARHG domain-containing protein [Pseudoflavitalea sp. G-6-1-2]NML21977.1 YARHG domain-containing protein [Pseudoflavitalea sp. G-6-1-2]